MRLSILLVTAIVLPPLAPAQAQRAAAWRAGALLRLAASEPARRAPEWDYCDGKMLGTPDERIRNCTALLESGPGDGAEPGQRLRQPRPRLGRQR